MRRIILFVGLVAVVLAALLGAALGGAQSFAQPSTGSPTPVPTLPGDAEPPSPTAIAGLELSPTALAGLAPTATVRPTELAPDQGMPMPRPLGSGFVAPSPTAVPTLTGGAPPPSPTAMPTVSGFQPSPTAISRPAAQAAVYLPLIAGPSAGSAALPIGAAEASRPPSPDIIGGSEAARYAWPWQGYMTTKIDGFGYSCGAVLIDPFYALIASHCVISTTTGLAATAADTHLTFGKLSFTSGPTDLADLQYRNVAEIITHPDFDRRSLRNDVALLRLSEPVQLTRAVRPIPLALSPQHDALDAPGVTVTTTGWGRTQETPPTYPTTLLQVDLKIYSTSECADQGFEPNYDNVPASEICAGQPKQSWSTCRGDSGGPLVARDGQDWRLVGITSWNMLCGQRNSPSVFQRVSWYAPWILAHIRHAGGFNLVARQSNKCLDVAGGVFSRADGTRVIQWDCRGPEQVNQVWRLRPDTNGTTTVIPAQSGKCLDVAGGNGSIGDGAPVQQWRCLGGQNNQRWKLIPTDDNTYQLQAAHSDKCLDVAGGSSAYANGSPLIQWRCLDALNQQWRLRPIGTFQIVVGHSGKCLDVAGAGIGLGTNVHQWECGSVAEMNQLWSVLPVGRGTFQIVDANSGRCLEVSGGPSATQRGANVQIWDCLGPLSTNQLWRFSSAPDGLPRIVAAQSDKCLDVTGGTGATGNGVNVQQWDCLAGQTNQSWRLVPTGPVQLLAAQSDKCLDVSGGTAAQASGANVQQWECLGLQQRNQLWLPVRVSGAQYRIVSASSGKCLDVAGGTGSLGDSANVQQWGCLASAQANQLWRLTLVDVAGGRFQLRAAHSGSCLDIAGGVGSLGNGANAQQWRCLGAAQTNQLWRLKQP